MTTTNHTLLRDSAASVPGFRYIVDELQLLSAVGRRQLLDTPFSTDTEALENEYRNIERLADLINDPQYRQSLADLRHRMMELQDIQGTLYHVAHHVVLDEIELFELKTFANICVKARQSTLELGIEELLPLPDLLPVFQLLDPDDTKVPNFYIYDSYDLRLAPLRKELRGRQTLLESTTSQLTPEEKERIQAESNDLFARQTDVEREVISRLSDELHPFAEALEESLRLMGYADILQAKAQQAIEMHLCRPTFGTAIRYSQLRNPMLQHRNEELNLRYQPVDVAIAPGLTLVTGANMAGKTVMLKTLGTAQLMAQYGMMVPAEEAQTVPVEEVLFCIGDEQNEMNGLSSYASEITKISAALEATEHRQLMVLIDEPARTTNPLEGKAIVQALGTLLQQRESLSIITTHYSQLGLQCHRLRVKGFVEDMADMPLTPQNINQFMDYSLIEDDSDEVPHEALRIASILGVDASLISLAQDFLEH